MQSRPRHPSAAAIRKIASVAVGAPLETRIGQMFSRLEFAAGGTRDFTLPFQNRRMRALPWQDNKIKGGERVVPSMRHVARFSFHGHRQYSA